MAFNLKGGIKPKEIVFEKSDKKEEIVENSAIKGSLDPDISYFKFDLEMLYAGDNDGEMPYVCKTGEEKNTHMGQIKLFIEELLTILYYGDGIKQIVYVGAMEGHHTVVLADMFPSIKFHLYDKETKNRKFDKRLRTKNNVIIHNNYFTDDDIEMHKKDRKEILFFSDIRRTDFSREAYDAKNKKYMIETENIVWEDMLLQQSWAEKLKPKVASLKFRLPYAFDFILEQGKTRDYLDGVVMRQCFTSVTSSETRLIVKDINYRKWDVLSYERKSMFYNKMTRKHKCYNIFDDSKRAYDKEYGLDLSFETTVFVYAVRQYIISVGGEGTEEETLTLLKYIFNETYQDDKDIVERLIKNIEKDDD